MSKTISTTKKIDTRKEKSIDHLKDLNEIEALSAGPEILVDGAKELGLEKSLNIYGMACLAVSRK